MRLTLRTLLAYLDNTLEPRDAELLRQKLSESGFATQLVQRIRQTLVNPAVAAPSPTAVGPIQDANVIGEYLDSTLPGEQVAEIERACLESEVNLSEAAACHQILTMVLGEPAQVPASLRARIYELPDTEVEKIAASSSQLSSVSMDDDPSTQPEIEHEVFHGKPADPATSGGLAIDEMATIDSPLTSAHGAVAPVGRTDSGVSDAPTRLREAGHMDSESVGQFAGSPAMAGSKPRSTEDRIYGGSIRPSRITPWLVSLGLVAALLFAIVQSFQPLFSKREAVEVADSMDDFVEIAPPPGELDSRELDPGGPDSSLRTGSRVETMPVDEDTIDSPGDLLPMPAPDPVEADSFEELPTDRELMPPPAADAEMAELPIAETSEELPLAAEMPEPIADELPASPMTDMAPAGPLGDDGSPEPAIEAEMPPPASEIMAEEPAAPSSPVAIVNGEGTLVAALTRDGQWARLGKEASVVAESPIVCAPKFRATMTTTSPSKDDQNEQDPSERELASEITLIGPTGVRWLPLGDESEAVVAEEEMDYGLELSFGRIVVVSKQKQLTLPIKLGGWPMEITFRDEESVAAMTVRRSREPGLDPLKPENFSEQIGVSCVQGEMSLRVEGERVTLTTGEQWVRVDETEPEQSVAVSPPAWVDSSDEEPLVTKAKEMLLELLVKNKDDDGADQETLERLLLESRLFRRSEVAALAAESLLSLGLGEVYFGGDGIMNDPKQRQYWFDHYHELVAAVDRGPESAMLLRQSIAKMDAANADQLFQLLVGYSDEQLENGGAAELVELLNYDSTTVRVLALETLHEITGTTLYFRPEEPTAARRVQGIKKWNARLLKGEIKRGE